VEQNNFYCGNRIQLHVPATGMQKFVRYGNFEKDNAKNKCKYYVRTERRGFMGLEKIRANDRIKQCKNCDHCTAWTTGW
jgi:hypothetical protein